VVSKRKLTCHRVKRVVLLPLFCANPHCTSSGSRPMLFDMTVCYAQTMFRRYEVVVAVGGVGNGMVDE